jgi:hypothetical protein
MKTPLSRKSLKQHLTYYWWAYLLIAALAVGLVDLVYSVTAYRPPRDKTVGFFVYGLTKDEDIQTYLDHVHETEMSDQEVLSFQTLGIDDTYGPMQLMTYLAAGEGDVYLLPREQFLNNASSGSLLPLEDKTEIISMFDEAGISLQKGWRRETDSGETHLYGIPQEKLPGLTQFAWAQDGYLCVIVSSGNMDNALKFLRILCRDTLTAPEEPEQAAIPAAPAE